MTKLFKSILGKNGKLSAELYEMKAEEIMKIFKRSTSEQLRIWKFPVSPKSWGKKVGDKEKDVFLQV